MENRKIKILVVDDIWDNIITLKALLKEAFQVAEVYTANNGYEGLRLAEIEKPDVILLDIIMPGMDGYEVCRTLKNDPKLKTIPVIFVTALKDDKQSRILALESGADAFLTKPVDESELTAQIRAMFRIKEAEDRKLDEKERLKKLVEERTRELKISQRAALKLVEELETENEERKRIEEELRKNEERFRHISSSISDISYSCVLEPNGNSKINWLYGATESITGYTLKEIMDMQCWGKIVIEEDFPIFSENIIGLKPEQSEICNLRIRKKDGKIIWIQASSECVRGELGTNTIYGGLVDITERMLAAEALRESEETFRELYEHSPMGYQSLDENGCFLMVNKVWLKTLGYEEHEVLGKWFGDFLAPEFVEGFKKRFQKFKELGEIQSEFYMLKKNGSKVFINFNGRVSHRLNGEFKQTHCILGDYTERKLAEDALRESEFFFRESQKAAHIGSYNFNLKQDFWTSSEILEQIFGIGKDFVRNLEGWLDIAHPEDRTIMEKYFMEEVISNRSSFNKEYRIIRKTDQEIRWVLGLGQLIYDREGNIESMVGTVQDITERKKAEKSLEESHQFQNSLLKTIPYGMDIVDEEGNILFQSENMETIFGQKAIGQKCWSLYRDDHSQCYDCPLHSGIKIGETELYETKGVLGGRTFEISHTGMWYNGKKAMLEIFIDITERKKVEEALKENNIRLEFAMKVANMSWWEMEMATGNVTFEKRKAEMLGYSPERFKHYTDFMALVHPDDYEPAMNAMRQHLNGNQDKYEIEYRIKTISGEYIWFYDIGSVTKRDSNGAPLYVSGLVLNINERKLAEIILTKSEERYRSFISQVSEGVYRFESDLPMDLNLPVEEQIDFIYDHMFIAECNDALVKMYSSLSTDEIIGKTHLDFHGGRDNQINRESLRNFILNGYTVQNEITEEKNSLGQIFYFSNNSIGIIENNQLVRMWGTQIDISEKLKADVMQDVLHRISNAALTTDNLEELIEIIREQLGRLIDITNFFIAFYDEKTEMLSTLFEKDENDSINSWSASKSITGYVIRNQKSMLINDVEMKSLIDKGEIDHIGTPSKIWLGVPLMVNKKPVGAIVVQSYTRADAYTEKDKQILEFVSYQVCIAIERKKADEDLKQALLKAQESDRLKSAFLANMSHEIRTPLNSIVGFSELMLDTDYTDQQYLEFAHMINSSGNNLLAIINDIMDISKIEAGQIQLYKSNFSLRKLINEIQKQYSFKAQEKDLNLIADLQDNDNPFYVFSDENRIRQIIVNFVSNAIKFTHQGSVEIGARIVDNEIQIHVKDSGIGISQEHHAKIFERFGLIESSESKRYGGNGLGLTISKSLVELLGGRIWLESEPGKGSTFYFTIPL